MNDHTLSLFITAEHPCGYYEERSSANLIPDPHIAMTNGLYSLLVTKGFRRSGSFVYRPHCPRCQSCIPCRIDVEAFRTNRNQRRCLKRNTDLTVHIKNGRFSDEYFELYERYINNRHIDGNMAYPAPDDFTQFLLSDWCDVLFIESRLKGRLVSVAVSDFLPAGPSAVYTFFDPNEAKRSLGTLAVLQQIWLARLYQKPHVYLGYWIENHPKMHYKRQFNPIQHYHNQQWQYFDSQ